jgi:hypothetical protein
MDSSELTVQLRCEDLDSADLQDLVYDLNNDLRSQPGVESELKPSSAQGPFKGDPISTGAILLQLLAGGGVLTSLIGVLRVYFQRVPKLELELQGPNGRKMILVATNFDPDTLKATTKQMEKFFGVE